MGVEAVEERIDPRAGPCQLGHLNDLRVERLSPARAMFSRIVVLRRWARWAIQPISVSKVPIFLSRDGDPTAFAGTTTRRGRPSHPARFGASRRHSNGEVLDRCLASAERRRDARWG
jgi:hypothetical protein